MAVNHRGQVLGYGFTPDYRTYPILWERDGLSTQLPFEEGIAVARAINARGQIVGYSSNGACLWTR
jgi:hypothetical protein